MATDIKLETKQVSHVVWDILNGAEMDVVGAKEHVNDERWPSALKDIDVAIAMLQEARKKVRDTMEKHGVRD